MRQYRRYPFKNVTRVFCARFSRCHVWINQANVYLDARLSGAPMARGSIAPLSTSPPPMTFCRSSVVASTFLPRATETSFYRSRVVAFIARARAHLMASRISSDPSTARRRRDFISPTVFRSQTLVRDDGRAASLRFIAAPITRASEYSRDENLAPLLAITASVIEKAVSQIESASNDPPDVPHPTRGARRRADKIIRRYLVESPRKSRVIVHFPASGSAALTADVRSRYNSRSDT